MTLRRPLGPLAIGLFAAGALAACAPAPGGAPSDPPTPTDAVAPTTTAPTSAPTSAPTETATPQPATTPASAPADGTSSVRAATAVPDAAGWTSLDAKLVSASDMGQFALPASAADYLRDRLDAPCDLRITVFAAHSDGYFVSDESGTCDGAQLAVYGPNSGGIGELVSFASVPDCAELRRAGVPAGVPATKLFPDGLACLEQGALQKY